MVSRNLKWIAVLSTAVALYTDASFAARKSCPDKLVQSVTVESLLKLKSRPEPEDLIGLKGADFKSLIDKHEFENEESLRETALEMAKELLEKSDGRRVYIFARDGEYFYDGLQTALRLHPKGRAIADRFVLLNISRLISGGSTVAQLQKFMKAHQMDLDKVLEGKERIVWLDTGNRGSIFLKLLTAIAEMVDYSKSSSQVNKQLANMLTGIEIKLLASEQEGTFKSVLKAILEGEWKSASQVGSYLSGHFYFDEILQSKRKSLGMPEDRYQRYHWVIDKIEHNPHFLGRANSLSSNGQNITSYYDDEYTNRETALALQLRLIGWFSKKSVRSRLNSAIQKAVTAAKTEPTAKGAGKGSSDESVALKDLDVKKLKNGDWITMPSGLEVEYLSEGGEGKRGFVLKVRDEEGMHYALKLANDTKEDTIRSFSEEVDKVTYAKKAGFRPAEIYESGKTFHLKEWAQGLLARDWVAKWASGGYKKTDPALVALKKILRESASRGLYLGDLNRKNLIWTGEEWIVVDSGSLTDQYSPDEALERYYENISSRWTKELSSDVGKKLRKALEE